MLDTTAPVMRSYVTEWVRVWAEAEQAYECEGWVRDDEADEYPWPGMIVMKRMVPFV